MKPGNAYKAGLAQIKKIIEAMEKLPEFGGGTLPIVLGGIEDYSTSSDQPRFLDAYNLSPKFDFEAIYKLYPRKQGKLNGIKKLRKEIRSGDQYADLCRAVGNFVAHHRRAGTEPTFLPYFSTFVSTWREWLLPETGTVKIPGEERETTEQYLERMKKQRDLEDAEIGKCRWCNSDGTRFDQVGWRSCWAPGCSKGERLRRTNPDIDKAFNPKS